MLCLCLPVLVSNQWVLCMLWKTDIIIRYFTLQRSVYCVSKMALFGLTMALAKELGEDNIRVNCIAPGLIKTRFAECVSMT